MKKALIIACFDSYSYNVRTKFIENYFFENKFQITFLVSNYDHRKKEKYLCSRHNVEYIKVPSYKKNMSISRIISHIVFAIKVKKYLKNNDEYDLIYCTTPPNFIFQTLKNYKGKVIFEIGDLWPETFPNSVSNIFIKMIFFIWKSIRSKSIDEKKIYIFECELFENKIRESVPKLNIKGSTIYLCKENKNKDSFDIQHILDENKIKLLYLGSLNNIIDIDFIVNLCIKISIFKNVVLGIIGDGENKREFLNNLSNNKIEYIDYGIVFDSTKKANIIDNYDFALNIMKSTVCVGLTMKSIDYFYYGIPIINNISYDTFKIISKDRCGFNISSENIDEVVLQIVKTNQKEYDFMKKNVNKVYNNNFSEQVFYKKFAEMLELFGKGNNDETKK